MKKEKGITLISLVVYVIVMIIVLATMSLITTQFYSNTQVLQGNVEEILEFNVFNNYFLKEVKTTDNKVEELENVESNKYILFSSGNSFSLLNKAIYYNDKKICDGVQNVIFSLGKNGDGQDNTIINVTVDFSNFSKTINYKIENIY